MQLSYMLQELKVVEGSTAQKTYSHNILSFTTRWKLVMCFVYSQKTGSDMSCKLSPETTFYEMSKPIFLER